MLFQSQIFLLVFLPLVLGGYYLAARYSRRVGDSTRKWLLVIASLWFYGYWDLRLLPLLLLSILANWVFARLYPTHGRYLLTLGVVLNLVLLGIFKYADFFANTVAFLFGTTHEDWNIILPLAISFFTFQQISYLVDLRRKKAPTYSLLDYTLYISFFPQLIAGPIVRHHEIIGQFSLDPVREGLGERMGKGLTLLVIGLVKKVFLADPLGLIANPLFGQAAEGAILTFGEAWTAAFAYTFQLYYDFSSYSDMAIGMGLMFGFTLPLNFDSPYKAATIRDFWRRWHMTLTRFLRDYVYTPVGLSLPRKDKVLRESAATMVTMTLIGAWHGAAWSYVVFGAMHGVALIVDQTWVRLRLHLPHIVGWFLTFMFVAVTLVLFRSEDFAVSAQMWSAMVGMDGLNLDVGALRQNDFLLILTGALIAFLGPNSQTIALERLRPMRLAAVTSGLGLLAVLIQIGGSRDVEFIYFQF
ncbi:MAG: MBOAT family O-acyltransferase [Pseudomonadota bacterium]|nr:MBOAT family O-acyltransferase [Pseudomonadota bacterium]